MTTATVDPLWGPAVTVTKATDGSYSAVFTIEDNAPVRSVTAEETLAGITSLDPPTVTASAQATAAQTHRALIDASKRAVTSAVESTLLASAETLTPGQYLMMSFRVAAVVRKALRELGEDI